MHALFNTETTSHTHAHKLNIQSDPEIIFTRCTKLSVFVCQCTYDMEMDLQGQSALPDVIRVSTGPAV